MSILNEITGGFQRGNLDMLIGSPIKDRTPLPSNPRSFASVNRAVKPGDKFDIIIGGFENPLIKKEK